MSNQIEMAEQQLTGYAHAKVGYSIVHLADGMGLTSSEWEKIKERGLVRLSEADVVALDEHLHAVSPGNVRNLGYEPCSHIFKTPACGYTGEFDQCNKTVEACLARASFRNFNGYPK